jgi:lipoprotein-releasing system permease protein
VFKPLAINLGLRYAGSRLSFISFISIVAVLGLVLSVAVLLLVTSVINGFERELKERVLGIMPHVAVRGREPVAEPERVAAILRTGPGVTGVAAFVQGAALLVANERSAGVMLTGMEPSEYAAVSDLANYLSAGSVDGLRGGAFGVVVGAGVAQQLEITVGDSVFAVMPEANVTLVGIVPRRKRLEVLGIIDTGSELDARAAYLHIDDAARLFRLGGRVEGLHVRIDDVFAADEVARWAQHRLGRDQYFTTTWKRAHGNLYRAIGFVRATMFLLVSLLVGVAAFNLVSALIMVVNQRRADIAVLRTMGSNTSTIMVAFIVLGSMIGLVGVGLGVALGVAGSLLIQDGYRWFEQVTSMNLMNQYFVNYLPSELRLADVVLVSGTALLLCLLSTLYPAWRAASTEPAEVLKHE